MESDNCKEESKINETITEDQKSKYIIHEILNPISVINNCAELLSHKIKKNDKNDKNDKEDMLKLVSIIKKQVHKCSEISDFLLTNNRKIEKIDINEFIEKYIKEINERERTYNIYYYPPSNVNQYYLKSNKSETYLKIIFDNIIKNTLKYNNFITITLNPISFNKLNAFEIIITGSNNYKNNYTLSHSNENIDRFKVCKGKYENNYVGLEIIDRFCSIMDINWTLMQDNNIYRYKLTVN